MTIPPIPQPPVIFWFKAYAVLLMVLYLAVAAMSLVFFFVDKAALDMEHMPTMLIGVVILFLGLFFAAAVAVPLFAVPRPWSWVYSLVVICLGLSSPCFMLFSIPLLIFWLKPEVKAYYRKQ